MSIVFIIFLSFVQALTEFLPVSSSAHIILLSQLSNIKEIKQESDIITIALHIGSLIAVLLFYWHEIIQIISFKNIKLLKNIIIAFIPILIIGGITTVFNFKFPKSNILIGIMLLIFGIILYLVDKKTKQVKLIENINTFDAFCIGVFQLLALIPGVSRSGITITAGRLTELKRGEAIKFSFLLSILTIGASSVIPVYKFYKGSEADINYDLIILSITGILLSAIFSYIVLEIFVKISNKFTFLPFVIYRIILGLTIIILYF